jgi:hypothetical protein
LPAPPASPPFVALSLPQWVSDTDPLTRISASPTHNVCFLYMAHRVYLTFGGPRELFGEALIAFLHIAKSH